MRQASRTFREAVWRRLFPVAQNVEHAPPPPHDDDDDENACQQNQIMPEKSVTIPEVSGSVEPDCKKSEYVLHDSSESDCEHLTRAQRKRIRKKRLKEAASQRRKLIGPLFQDECSQEGINILETNSSDIQSDGNQSGSRPNKAIDNTLEGKDSVSSKAFAKVKNRRHAKKLNKEKAQRSVQHGGAFMADICGNEFVIKHL